MSQILNHESKLYQVNDLYQDLTFSLKELILSPDGTYMLGVISELHDIKKFCLN
jgi:hypothetical protein